MTKNLSLPLTLLATACGAVDAAPAAKAPVLEPPVGTSAGDLARGVDPDRDAAAIATLRARGRAALDELLAAYDGLPDNFAREALAATIDRVAAQRYATRSRLFWHTDLAAAIAEAKRENKPILSLKMLGRLDEDLSCANSRFFRTILYPDPAIGKLLREHFVLHWSSERPVPRVTVDFGDGRRIERTITGNSIHYILDATGAPIDALPGLYAPSAFLAELQRSRALFGELARAGARAAQKQHDHHAARFTERQKQFSEIGLVGVVRGLGRRATPQDYDGALMQAQRAAMSKMYVEAPQLAVLMDVGTDPTLLANDVDVWTGVGQTLYPGFGTPITAKRPAAAELTLFGRGSDVQIAPRQRVAPPPPDLPPVLSVQARGLVADVIRSAPSGASPTDAQVDAMIARLEQTLVADTAMAELKLRQPIRQQLMRRGEVTLEALNRFVYDQVFATPAADPWLGLLPRDAYTGLPGDGVIAAR